MQAEPSSAAETSLHAPNALGPGCEKGTSVGRMIAALYGWDLENAPELANPVGLLSEGYELLALDRPAVAAFTASGTPHATVEEWLYEIGADGDSVRALANSASLGWADHHPDALTLEDVFWPLLDHLVQPWIWSALASGLLLVDAFKATGVDRVRFLRRYPVHLEALASSPSDVVPDLWSRLLGDIAQPIDLPADTSGSRARLWVSRTALGWPLRWLRHAVAELRFELAAQRLPNATDGRTVLALAGRELLRSSPIVDRICEHLGSSVVTVPWVATRTLVRDAAALSPAPALPTPPLERSSFVRERRLRRGVLKNLNEHDLRELEAARPEITAALENLATAWAMHARRLRWMAGALRRLDARLVIGARLDVTYEGPIDAADRAGIAALTLPHGIRQWSPPARVAPTPRRVHISGIVNPTAASGTMRLCKDSLIEYEYPHRVRSLGLERSPDRPFTVLAVTDGFGSVNQPSTGILTHAKALEWLADIAARNESSLEVIVKPHPGNPEDEQLLVQPLLRDRLRFVSRDIDLFELFRVVDVVLGVNCSGTSLVHAARTGMPIARLITEDQRSFSGWLWEGDARWASFWDEKVPTFRDEASLKEFIQASMLSEERVEEARALARMAATTLIPERGDCLVDIIDEVLARPTSV